jgi:hypothetical protein
MLAVFRIWHGGVVFRFLQVFPTSEKVLEIFLCKGHKILFLHESVLQTIIRAPNDPCILAKFGSDLLYTNQESCSAVWRLQSTGDVEVFARKEEGSLPSSSAFSLA